jgi:hypothetical protein
MLEIRIFLFVFIQQATYKSENFEFASSKFDFINQFFLVMQNLKQFCKIYVSQKRKRSPSLFRPISDAKLSKINSLGVTIISRSSRCVIFDQNRTHFV